MKGLPNHHHPCCEHDDCEKQELALGLQKAMDALIVYANEKNWRTINHVWKELPYLEVLDPVQFGETVSREPWMIALEALNAILATPNLRPDERNPMLDFLYPGQRLGTGVS